PQLVAQVREQLWHAQQIRRRLVDAGRRRAGRDGRLLPDHARSAVRPDLAAHDLEPLRHPPPRLPLPLHPPPPPPPPSAPHPPPRRRWLAHTPLPPPSPQGGGCPAPPPVSPLIPQGPVPTGPSPAMNIGPPRQYPCR